MMVLYRFVLTLALMAMSTAADVPSELTMRELGDYQYVEDLSGAYTKYSSCFKVKIQDNGNDDNEGNSYFYNGKYHAQYQYYAAFTLCGDSSCEKSQCHESLKSLGYVTDLRDYLEENVAFVQEYCNACTEQCRRRRLNDGDMTADCSTCANQCSLMTKNEGSGNDEADYLDCQAAYNDGNIQYYRAPACNNGQIVMGLFYDNECTVKAMAEPQMDFNYNTFGTVEGICAACNGNDDTCANMYLEATHCQGVNFMAGDGDSNVCKKYYEAVKEVTYARRRKSWNIRGIFITSALLIVTAGFLSHTYYLRHRNKTVNDNSIPLSKFDHGSSGPPAEDQNYTTPQVTVT